MAKKQRFKKGGIKTTVKHPRGTNYLEINFGPGPHDPDEIEAAVNNFNYDTVDYLRTRNKPDGHHYKPPQGVVVVITVTKGNNTFHYTKITPYDYVINKRSLKAFVDKTVSDLLTEQGTLDYGMEDDDNDEPPDADDQAADYLHNTDPRYIESVSIKFIYGK